MIYSEVHKIEKMEEIKLKAFGELTVGIMSSL